jgi:hypothetical protein
VLILERYNKYFQTKIKRNKNKMFKLTSLHEANGGAASLAEIQKNREISATQEQARQQELHRRFGAAESAGPLVLRASESQEISAAVLPSVNPEQSTDIATLPPVQNPEASQPSHQEVA